MVMRVPVTIMTVPVMMSFDQFKNHLQVLLACELGKPLFLHERDAHPEMVSILERWS